MKQEYVYVLLFPGLLHRGLFMGVLLVKTLYP